jgi:hypothetical protein
MAEIHIGSYVALVDDEDYERISAISWNVRIDRKNGCPYAVGGGTWMHREVMGLERGNPNEVDHRDTRATLDNRKQNLRVCTRSENNCNRGMRCDNSSGIKGVSADPHKPGYWKAQIMKNKRAYNLGSFLDKEDAVRVYAEAAHRLHGEFARIARVA